MKFTYGMAQGLTFIGMALSWLPLVLEGHYWIYAVCVVLLLGPYVYERRIGLDLR